MKCKHCHQYIDSFTKVCINCYHHLQEDPLKEVKKSKNFKKYSLEARERIKLAVKIQKVIKKLEKIINEL
jgi:hypothetical protein